MTKFAKTMIGVGLAGLAGVLSVVMQAPPQVVEVTPVTTRPFTLTVEDQGRTRAHNPYIVAAPVAGRLLCAQLDEGDRVQQGQLIARIALQPQNQRTLAVEQANLAAAEASLRAEQAILAESQGLLARAERELERRQELIKNRLASVEEVEAFQQAAISAEARMQSSQAAVEAASANAESVRSRLLGSGDVSTSGQANYEELLAPTDGTVLRVLEESERVVMAGTPLFEISNQDSIEVVVGLLTQDAVSVTPGDAVQITGWGGDYVIDGTVRYIEPEAFTKFSALGVEEQRVNVIIDLLNAPANLGAEYRVEVAIVVWESESELTVPASSLFQRVDGWNVFVVTGQLVALRAIEIGYRNREYAQVVAGLTAGEVVIQYPSDLIEEGLEVSY